ncbi:carbonyl reductase [NADPH] 1-like isoform X1 [Chrysoperla carnea]|uniref:carbonyl reductase [NADPH] 1-like isoform X1 n=1 Tax=Chrysoperla carnea TaxID=189513 RepID=UPI001D081FD8|nr:carbonyl reductase [NADPH] 1-like isoform X1 [Chrysoperla carnea]XP_044728962.1 carbonyl reductase [NADPH] 1-like isoform X1 [Chrysoperla carnea]XP_044728963.1 carbonyl reductase [NADPH] 1-like isoform X1 [Chrysoperla carnea]
MSAKRVAVVTGSNKGIGYAIVKGLCEKFNGVVYLTARDVERGQEAVKKLNSLGFKPEFHQLDVNDVPSIDKFRDHIKEKYGGIDVLVNNAVIAFKEVDSTPFAVQAEVTIDVNYFGLLRVCNSLFPILRPHARVVNVSSAVGHLSCIRSVELRQQFADRNLSEEKLSVLMRKFVSDAKEGKHFERGWGNSAYVVSKVGVSALTFIQQREMKTPGVVINAVHPGYVDTDLTSHKGHLTIEQGAEAPLFLALQPVSENEIKGKFVWNNKTVVDWYSRM